MARARAGAPSVRPLIGCWGIEDILKWGCGMGGLNFEHFRTPCVNEEKLREWLETYLGLTFAKKGICAGHSSPFEYLWRAYREPASDLVVWAPRGGGKTRLGALATLLDLIHKPGVSVRILGGSLEQSLRMWEHLFPD